MIVGPATYWHLLDEHAFSCRPTLSTDMHVVWQSIFYVSTSDFQVASTLATNDSANEIILAQPDMVCHRIDMPLCRSTDILEVPK